MFVDVFLLLFIPPAIGQLIHAPSTAPYFFLASLMYLALNYKNCKVKKTEFILLLFFILHYFIASILTPDLSQDFIRFFMHLVGVLILILTSRVFLNKINKINIGCFNGSIVNILVLFMISALASAFGFSPFGREYEKSVLFFSEPSHFAILFAPFFISFLILNDNVIGKIFCICMVAYSYVIGSLISFVSVLLYLAFSPVKMIFLLTFGFALINTNDISYFLNRLPLVSGQTIENAYFLASVDEMWRSLDLSNYIGFGLGQMGVLEPSTDASNDIYMKNGDYIVRYEGATLLLKIITEFGMFGVIFGFLWVGFVLKSYVTLIQTKAANVCPKAIFFHAIIYVSSILIFIRALGYFNALSVFILAGFMHLSGGRSCEED